MFCAKGLSTLIGQAESSELIKGIPLVIGGIRLNHLVFADDCVLFGRASLDE